jgi:nucleoside-diphosphate-sugar epimerase
MRVFITGASGFIGSEVTKELVGLGHTVVALARSEKSAETVAKLGATPLRGSLEDTDVLKKGASESDGVINLGFNHDFSQYGASLQVEIDAVEAMGDMLKKRGLPFVIANGGPSLAETIDLNDTVTPRAIAAAKVIRLAERDVRSSVVRLPPCVHDGTKGGFASFLVGIAKQTGVSGYAGNGSNRWCAVHRMDAVRLFCMAFEEAPAGSLLQAVGDGGIPVKEIAEKIGEHLNIPVKPIADEDLEKHFGWLAMLIKRDIPAKSTLTQKLLGWQPMHPGLLHSMDSGHFFDNL